MTAFPSVRLCLVRHAQARAADGSYNHHTPLSTLGEAQAAAVAQAFVARGMPAAIYSSPYPRCVQTARPLSAAAGVTLRTDERLREFEFDTCTLAEATARTDLVIWDGSHRGCPGGETMEEFSRRVASCLADIVDGHLGSAVAVFTHAGVIDAAIRWCVGLPADAPWLYEMPLSNCSISEVDVWPRGRVEGGAPRYAAFLRVADIAHLVDSVSEI